MGTLLVIHVIAQPYNITLSLPESGTQLHQARNSITFAAGYSYTPGGEGMVAEIVNPVVSGDVNYAPAIHPDNHAIDTSLAVGKTAGGLQVVAAAVC